LAGGGEGTRVLVVDDEPSLVYAVGTALRYEGYDVLNATSGAAALSVLSNGHVDLVVLDVMMPDFDGFDMVRWLRAAGLPVPVLFLTARDATEDKVEGLRIGGDDYLTKPFSLDELIARIQAILRRAPRSADTDRGDGGVAPGADPPRADGDRSGEAVLRFADVTLDENTHEVWRSGDPVPLTALEFELLRYFLHRPRRVLAKRELLRGVWNYEFGGDPNVVETYMSYLRKKLDHGRTPLLHTIRGAGYILREPPPAVSR
jgi:two-component system OmpR family response regulator